MKSEIITGACTNSPTAPPPPPPPPRCLCDIKSCMCMPNWLNNLEPVTSHQKNRRRDATCSFSISFVVTAVQCWGLRATGLWPVHDSTTAARKQYTGTVNVQQLLCTANTYCIRWPSRMSSIIACSKLEVNRNWKIGVRKTGMHTIQTHLHPRLFRQCKRLCSRGRRR